MGQDSVAGQQSSDSATVGCAQGFSGLSIVLPAGGAFIEGNSSATEASLAGFSRSPPAGGGAVMDGSGAVLDGNRAVV